MEFSTILFIVIAIVAVCSGIDRFFDGKLGLGKEFEKGFAAMGPLAMAMIGISCLSPYLERFLNSFVSPLFVKLGADPSVAVAFFVATDSGCYPIAKEMASDVKIANFVTFILASTIAPALSFMLPIGLLNIRKSDIPSLAIGCAAGLIAIPIGSVPGGLMLGLTPMEIFRNLIPVILVDAILIIGFLISAKKTIAAISVLAKFLNGVITFGLVSTIFQELTGIIFLKDLQPSKDVVMTIGNIAFVLSGAYPLLKLIQVLLNKKLVKFAWVLRTDGNAIIGMMGTLANCFAMLPILKTTNSRGVALNVAFAIGAGWVFGDFLGFAASVDPACISGMIVGKLTIAVVAVGLAEVMFSRFGEKRC
jgi:ethanolamine transporter